MAKEIVCPKCKEIVTPNDNWDFIDGENRTATCPKCKHKFQIIIERPIEYYVPENE